jgi:hypothetical protein
MVTATKTRTVSSQCNAKDKSKCRFHGHADTATPVTTMQEKISALFKKPSAEPKDVPASELIDGALNSSLDWKGEKPDWWDSYTQELKNDPALSTTAELVDVVDSPVGPLAVIWQHESQAANDRGISLDSGYGVKVCYYKSMKTGENLGYVKMAYISKETLERSFGNDEFTPFRVRARYGGSYINFEENDDFTYGERNLTGEALLEKRRELWVAASKDQRKGLTDANGKYISYPNITKEHLPVDDAQVEKELKVFHKQYKKEMDEKARFFKVPYVDFSRVEEPLKGKGYGTALYVYTARMLAKEGKVLRGSGIQSGDAQKAWAGFKKKFPNNVSTITRKYSGQTHTDPILDFRKK